MANRARNDIRRARDLGTNTLYRAGEAINPGVEATTARTAGHWAAGASRSAPTIGRGRSPAPGDPCRCHGPYGTAIVTAARVPLRGYPAGRRATPWRARDGRVDGRPGGRAATASSLWVQGGMPTDPVLFGPYPGQFGFGALRCTIDNLNGDNVEWIAYPKGGRARLLLRVLRQRHRPAGRS